MVLSKLLHAMLTASGFFVLAWWRSHCMNNEDLKTVISKLVTIGSSLRAFWGWYYMNDNWRQWCYHLRTTIFTIIGSFLPAFLIGYIVNDYNLQRWLYLKSAIAVLSAKALFLPSFWRCRRWQDIIDDNNKSLCYLSYTIVLLSMVVFSSFWGSYYLNDENQQRWYYIRSFTALLPIIGYFFTAL